MASINIAQQIARDILNGKLKPGEALAQTGLSQRFSVSRIPVRDALRSLATEGLVTFDDDKVARVVSLSAEELDEVFDLRVLLETRVLTRAIEQRAAADIAELKYALERSVLEAGREDWVEADMRFHDALYKPSGLVRHIAIIRGLRQTCIVHSAAYHDLNGSADLVERWVTDHREIVAAFIDGHVANATTALAAHTNAARAFLLSRI